MVKAARFFFSLDTMAFAIITGMTTPTLFLGCFPNTTTTNAFLISSQRYPVRGHFPKTTSSSRFVWQGMTANDEEQENTSHPKMASKTVMKTTSSMESTAFVSLQERFPLMHSVVEETKNPQVNERVTLAPWEEDDTSSSFSATLDRSINPRISTLTINLLATAGCVSLMNMALMEWEWLQTLRYAWPFALGGLFLYQGLFALWRLALYDDDDDDESSRQRSTPPLRLALSLLKPSNGSSSSTSLQSSWWLPVTVAVAGAALMVGGAADAWLPVYVTGPNLFTAAGLGPDAAAYLLAVTLWQSSAKTNNTAPVSHLRTILLAAQLYILGAGSLDDIVSQTTVIVSNVM